MQLTALTDSELGVSREDLAKAFRPFVLRFVTDQDPEWSSEMSRRKRKTLKGYAKRLVLGWLPSTQRREQSIVAEYTKAWHSGEYDNYSLSAPLTRVSPWVWNGQQMLASDVGATRFRQILLSRVIEQLKPRTVLEVGCGNGVNLLLLACLFPQIDFTGIELTEQGHRAALELQKLATLPAPMQEYAPLPLADPSAFRKIHFLQGNAADLPFEDESFDLVITVLALEQMERVRHEALREIARVARRHSFMIEPFREVNDRGWPRRNVIRRNYFGGRIADLPTYGLEPALAVNDFPQEAFLKACAVLSHKRSPAPV